MAKVTIEDISRQTGLSRGTVSRALNDRPDISEPTKQRVLEACRQLNYVPSQAARSLATGRSYALAVVVDTLPTPTSLEFIRGVIRQADTANYAVNVSELIGDAAERRRQLTRVARQRIDALLIAANLDAGDAQALQEGLGKQPVVCFGTRIDGVDSDVFAPDQVEAGRLVARHLLEVAGREIVYLDRGLAGPSAERRRGIEEVLQAEGLDAGAVIRVVDAGDAQAAIDAVIGSARGIAACDDGLAIQAMMLAERAGRQVGRDVAVVGQGNSEIGTGLRPALTSVDFAGQEAGQRAAAIALQRVNAARQDSPQEVVVTPELIVRASSRLSAGPA
jgi:LacI family transcriptional regulator